MLKLFCEGRIKMMEKRETWVDWEDKAKGKVPQYLYYVQTEDEQGNTDVFQVKSKTDYSKLIDIPAVLTVGFWTMGNKSGLTLIDAKSAQG